jgi:hypothetical protein
VAPLPGDGETIGRSGEMTTPRGEMSVPLDDDDDADREAKADREARLMALDMISKIGEKWLERLREVCAITKET